MAKKQTGQGRPRKGSPGQRKSRIRTSSVARPRRANLSKRSQTTRAKALHVLSDLRRDPKLTFSQAAKNREISLRSLWKHIGSELKRFGRRIRVTTSDRLHATLHIPSTKPGVLIPIHTKNSRERYLVGEWLASIVEAGRGDFSRLNRFPKGTYIDGVRLPTGAYEVQKILGRRGLPRRNLRCGTKHRRSCETVGLAWARNVVTTPFSKEAGILSQAEPTQVARCVSILSSLGEDDLEGVLIRGALWHYGIPSKLTAAPHPFDDAPFSVDLSGTAVLPGIVVRAGRLVTQEYRDRDRGTHDIVVCGEPYALIQEFARNNETLLQARGGVLVSPLFDVLRYQTPPFNSQADYVPILTSLGCHKRCGYCSHGASCSSLYGSSFSRRSRPWKQVYECMRNWRSSE